MARVALIVNPMAARTNSRVLGRIENAFKAEGWSVDILPTAGPGDAEALARSAVADGGVDVVATYGGDGTMIEAVTGTLDVGVPVGLLPGGTGNVLAGNLRLPRNPIAAVRTIVRGTSRAIDLGRYRDGKSERFFAVACGAGFEARLMETPSTAKRKWGMAAYVARGVKLMPDLESVLYRVTVDGESHELPAATMTVANCSEIVPPILSMHDGIRLDDGFLDVLAMNARSVGQAALTILQMLRRTTNRGNLVTHLRGRHVEVESDQPQPTGLDGEVVGVTPFSATVMPGALKVIVNRN